MATPPIPFYELDTFAPGKSFLISNLDSGEGHFQEAERMHRHNYYSVGLLLSGESIHTIDFTQHTVIAPALLLIYPGQVHVSTPAQTKHTGFIISFNSQALLANNNWETNYLLSLENCGCNLIKHIHPTQLLQLQAISQTMFTEYSTAQEESTSILKNLLNAFLIYCNRIFKTHIPTEHITSRPYQLVNEFRALVNTHFVHRTQVADYASLLCVTPGHLNDMVKAVTGKSVKHLINDRRILEAKRLLFLTDLTSKEVAWQLQFEDNAYFSRFFKKYTGQTPLAFQEKIRQMYNSSSF